MQKAEVWKPKPGCLLGLAFGHGCEELSRLQRRIDSTSRNYHRALKELQRLESERPQSDPPPDEASEASHDPDPTAPAPGPASEASPPRPSEEILRNEPNSGIASLANAASIPAPPPPSAPFPHPFSPPPHPLAEQS